MRSVPYRGESNRATTLKTLTMYLRAAKTEAEEAGIATDGMADSVSQLRDNLLTLTSGRVDIMLDEDTFKSTYEIMQDIANVWDTLSDVTQSNILNQIGGKRNANAIAALISEFQTAEKASDDAMNSFGSAIKENEKYLDSINGKIIEIKASFEALSGSVLNSDMVKFFLDLSDSVLDLLKVLSDTGMALPLSVLLATVVDVGKRLNEEKSSFAEAILSMSDTERSMKPLVKLWEKIESGAAGALTHIKKMPEYATVLVSKMTSLQSAMLSLSVAIAAIGALYALGKKVFIEHADRVEKARNITENYQDEQKKTENEIKTLNNLRGRYDELSAGVDDFGKNVSLTTDEYAEYLRIVDQVVQISPDLIKGVNDEGQAYLQLGDAIQAAIDKKKNYAKASDDNYYSDKNVVKGAFSAYHTTWDSIDSYDSYKSEIDTLISLITTTFNGSERDDLAKVLGLKSFDEIWGADGLEKLLEKRSAVISAVNDVLTANGTEAITSGGGNLITTINGLFDTLENSVNELSVARSNYGDSMLKYIQYTFDNPDLDNYINIAGLSDELKNVLSEQFAINLNPYVTFEKNSDSAIRLAREFVSMYEDGEINQKIADFEIEAQFLSVDGSSEKIEDYNKRVNEWVDGLVGYSESVKNVIRTYLLEQNNAARSAESAINRVYQASLKTSHSFTDATASLTKGYDAYKTALEDMADDGGLSLSSINDLQSALGDSGNITEFLKVENGLIKLDAEAWLARSRAKAEDSKTEAGNHISMLQKEIEILTKVKDLWAFNEDGTRNDGMSEAIRREISKLEELGTINGNLTFDFVYEGKSLTRDINSTLEAWYKTTGGKDGSPLTTMMIGHMDGSSAAFDQNLVLNLLVTDQDGKKFDLDKYVAELTKNAQELVKNTPGLSLTDALLQVDREGIQIGDQMIRGVVVNYMDVIDDAIDEQMSAGRLGTALGIMMQSAWSGVPLDLQFVDEQIKQLNLDLGDSEAIMAMFETALGQDLSDPLNLENISKNIQSAKDDVKSLYETLSGLNGGVAMDDAEFMDLLMKYPDALELAGKHLDEGLSPLEYQKAVLSDIIALREAEYKQIIANAKADTEAKKTTNSNKLAEAISNYRKKVYDDIRSNPFKYNDLSSEDQKNLWAFALGSDTAHFEDAKTITGIEDPVIDSLIEAGIGYDNILAVWTDMEDVDLSNLFSADKIESQSSLIASAVEKVTKAYTDLKTLEGGLAVGADGKKTGTFSQEEFLPIMEQYNVPTEAYRFEGADIVVEDWKAVEKAISDYAATASKVGSDTSLYSQILSTGKAAGEAAASAKDIEETQSALSSTLSLVESVKKELSEDGHLSSGTFDALVEMFGTEALDGITTNQDSLTELLIGHANELKGTLPSIYQSIWEAIINNANKSVSEYQDTLNAYDKATGFDSLMDSVRNAERPIDAIMAAMEYIGEADWDAKFINADGTLNVDEVVKWTKEMINASSASNDVKEALIAAVDASKELFNPSESSQMAEAMEKMSDAYADLEEIRSKTGKDGRIVLSQDEFMPILSSYEIPKSAFHVEDSDFVIDDMVAIQDAIMSVITTASIVEGNDALTNWLQTIGLQAIKDAAAINELNKTSEKLSSITSLMSTVQNEFDSQGFVSADTLSQIQSVLGVGEATLTAIADEQTDLIDFIYSEGVRFAEKLPAVHRDAWIKELDAMKKGISEYQKILDISDKVEGFESLMGTIKDAERPLDALIAAMEYIGETDWDPNKFISADGSLNVDAVAAYVKSAVNASDVSDSLKTSLIGVIDVATDMSSTFESVSESIEKTVSNVTTAFDNIANVGAHHQLTFDTFKQLMEIGDEYMEALEYQNGMLTLNADKYVQITESMAEAAIAEAEEKAALIELSDEYQYLISLGENLDSYQRDRLNDLDMQIQGFRTLASQINGAASALARFASMNVSSEDDMFSSAKEAMELINNVEKNKDSDFYGQFGNEGYQAAIKSLIPFERGTKEYEASVKRLNKYFSTDHPLEGINNFAGDLEKTAKSLNLYNEATGEITGDTATFARALGITEEAFRSLLRQTNLYIGDESQKFKIQDIDAQNARELWDNENTQESVIEYAIHPKFDVKDPKKVEGYEEAKERIEKYLGGSEQDGLAAFYADLSTEGLVDENGNLSKSIDEVAEKLGVSKDLIIDMIDLWNNGDFGSKTGAQPEITVNGQTDKVSAFTGSGETDVRKQNEQLEYVLGKDYIDAAYAAKREFDDIWSDADAKVAKYTGGTVQENAQQLYNDIQSIDGAMAEDGTLLKSISEISSELGISDGYLLDLINNANTLNNKELEIKLPTGEPTDGQPTDEEDLGTLETIKKQIEEIQTMWATVSIFDIDVTKATEALQTLANAIGPIVDKLNGITVSPELAETLKQASQLMLVLNGMNTPTGQPGTETPTPGLMDPSMDKYLQWARTYDPEAYARANDVAAPQFETPDLSDANAGVDDALEKVKEYSDAWSDTSDNISENTQTVAEAVGEEPVKSVKKLTDTVDDLNDTETEDLTESLEDTGDAAQKSEKSARDVEKTVEGLDGLEPEIKMPDEITEVDEETLGAVHNAIEETATLNAALVEAKKGEEDLSPLGIDASPAMTTLDALIAKLEQIISLVNSINAMSISVSGGGSGNSGSPGKTGDGGAAGNSYYGVAYARGITRSLSGRTLVGELGMETVVDPYNYRYYTVGERGAEFVDLPKDAIVFNAAQTEQLFKRGSTPSRGKAMAMGNAYAYTSGALSGIIKYEAGGGGGSSSSRRSSSKSKSSKEEDPFKDLLEEYEKLIENTEHLIEHQEHLYEVSENALSFDGMAASLAEQAKLYKQIMADALDGVNALKAQGATDSDEALQKLEEAYWDAYKDLYDIYDDLNDLYTDALKDKIDALTDGYETLIDAAEELSSSGMISTDTLTSILDNGLQYLSLLDKVGDSYVLNQEKLQDMMAAEKEQLAIQSALAYVNQLSVAAADKSANAIQNLIDATNQVADSTWNIVYAEAAALKNLGLTEDQYKQIIANIDKMRDLADQAAMDMADATSDLYSKQREAIDYILEKTKELIEYETEEQIEALEDQIDAFQEIIDKKRESLELTKDEDDYTKSVAEQTKEIAKMQAKIDQLSLDDSREAQAERAKLLEELKELQDKLAEEQADHSHELQLDALDKEAEEFEKRKEEEIETLEETISSEEKLYQAAIERIKNGWDTLYKELLDWNYEAGSVLNEEITENWEIALKAAEKYGSYLKALEAYKEGHGVDITLGTDASSLPHYHSGGIVDDRGSINSKEVLAVLKKGELVLDHNGKKGVYQIVDFAHELGKKLGIVVGELTTPLSDAARSISSVNTKKLVATGSKQSGDVFSPTFHVAIEHNGAMTDHDAQKYGEQIATTAIDKLYNAFKSRGISEVTTRLRTV